jgi:DNA-binding Lrp family transcriptional regulator
MLDDVDRRILAEIQRDGRLTNATLADRVNLSEAPCWRRLRRLETEGYIDGYRALVDRRRAGLGVHAFVHIKFSTHDIDLAGQFERQVKDLAWVLTCHNITGEVDYILQVVAPDLDAYGAFTVVLRNLPGVTAIHSSLALRSVKNTTELPLEWA